MCEDYHLWLKASARTEFAHCQEELVVKYGGHEDQLSRALPAMDRFRIWSILSGLASEQFHCHEQPTREELCVKELFRKLKILRKGSLKRGKQRAVEFCLLIEDKIREAQYSGALEVCEELLSCWATKPSGN